MIGDLRFAIRGFLRTPGFVLAVLAALALGIGANTAIFTVINTVLLSSLPYPDADRIVNVGRPGNGEGGIAAPLFTYWEQNNSGLEDLAAYQAGASMNMSGGDKPELIDAMAVSRNYFRLFGAHPILGRTFTSTEDRVVVISYGLWQRRFGAEPSILRKAISLGGARYTIAGVLAPGFQSYPPAEVWISLPTGTNGVNQAGILTVCGRLPTGVTIAQVNAQLAVLRQRYAQVSSTEFSSNPDVEATPLRQRITGDVRPALLILLGAVGMVLLIACANVANLLLARSSARQKEIVIRSALGARRERIVRQLLTESLLLAFAGGALGLVLGSWGVRALLALMPSDLPRVQEIAGLDARVAGFAFLLTLVTGVAFGLFPAWVISRPVRSLKQNHTLRLLVAAEVAIAVVLLCGAGLLIRSFAAMHSVSLGFDPHNLLTMEVSLAGPGYSKSSDVDRLMRQFVERAESIPGVEGAAMASALPLFGKMDMIFDIPGRPSAGRQFAGDVQWRFVSPHYFDMLRIPLLSGRFFRAEEPGRTVVINQAMARRFWPGGNAVGKSIFIGPGLGKDYQEGLTEIIGVTGDLRDRLNYDPYPVMYQLPSQIPDADMALLNGYDTGAILVRTRPGVAPMSVSAAVQQALLNIDNIPAAKVRTLERASVDSTARQNFNSVLLGLFASIALLLAAGGIYGVMSYSVQQRTQEIGIRAALGASRWETLSLVLGQALRTALVGITVGIVAALGLTRLIRGELFGVGASDPVTFVIVAVVLLGTAMGAAYFPAWRASRVDPISALRHE